MVQETIELLKNKEKNKQSSQFASKTKRFEEGQADHKIFLDAFKTKQPSSNPSDPLNPKNKIGFHSKSPRFKSTDKHVEAKKYLGPGTYSGSVDASDIEGVKQKMVKKDNRSGNFKAVARERHFVNILHSKADPGGQETGPAKYLGKGPFLKRSFNVSLPPQKFT